MRHTRRHLSWAIPAVRWPLALGIRPRATEQQPPCGRRWCRATLGLWRAVSWVEARVHSDGLPSKAAWRYRRWVACPRLGGVVPRPSRLRRLGQLREPIMIAGSQSRLSMCKGEAARRERAKDSGADARAARRRGWAVLRGERHARRGRVARRVEGAIEGVAQLVERGVHLELTGSHRAVVGCARRGGHRAVCRAEARAERRGEWSAEGGGRSPRVDVEVGTGAATDAATKRWRRVGARGGSRAHRDAWRGCGRRQPREAGSLPGRGGERGGGLTRRVATRR